MPQTVSHSELVSQRMRRPVGTSVFEENSYCCRLEGIPILQVLEKDGCFGLHLLDSIVFPGGGGQAADAGFINESIPIEKVEYNSSGNLIHWVRTRFKVDDCVNVSIDWERRFDHMQQHSGEHLASSVALAELGLKTDCSSLGQKTCTLDFVGSCDDLMIENLEYLVNERIRDALPVSVVFDPNQPPINGRIRRSIRMGDQLQPVDCCGTHVSNSRELQVFKILATQKHGCKLRVTFITGNRVLSYLKEMHNSCTALALASDGIPVGPDLIGQFKSMKTKIRDNRKAIIALSSRLAAILAAYIASAAVDKRVFFLVRQDELEGCFVSFLRAGLQQEQAKAKVSCSVLVLIRTSFFLLSTEETPFRLEAFFSGPTTEVLVNQIRQGKFTKFDLNSLKASLEEAKISLEVVC